MKKKRIGIPDYVNRFATFVVVDNITCNNLPLLDELLFQSQLPLHPAVAVLTVEPDVAKVLKNRFHASSLFDATGNTMLSRPYVEFVINNALDLASKEAKAKVVDLMMESNSESILDEFCQRIQNKTPCEQSVVELAQDFAQVAVIEHKTLLSAYA